jgi:ribosomal protein S18 acetylase RimI-like enzyme
MTKYIKISRSKNIDIPQLKGLFLQAGWSDKVGDDDRLFAMLQHSTIVLLAWDEDRLVGFVRCLTDFAFNGQINNLIVDKDYRGNGLGRKLIETILFSSDQVTYILRSDPQNGPFYRHLGFEPADSACIIKRKK